MLQPHEKELLSFSETGLTEFKLNDKIIALSNGAKILGVSVGKIENTEYTLEVYASDWGEAHPGEPPEWPEDEPQWVDPATITLTLAQGTDGTLSVSVDGTAVAGEALVLPGQLVEFTITPASGKDGAYTLTRTEGGATDISVDPPAFSASSSLYEITGGGAVPIDLSAYSQTGTVEKSLARINDMGAGAAPSTYSFTMPAYDTTLAAQFTGLAGRSFEIRLDADEALGPQTPGASGSDAGVSYLPNIIGEAGSPVSITVKPRSGTAQMTLSLNAQGSMFRLAANANVELAVDNVILKGLSAGHTEAAGTGIKTTGASLYIDIPASSPALDNTQALVYVGQGNTFEMLGSAELTGNYNANPAAADGDGGAARVSGGTFRMTGDDTAVHHNYAGHWGGGIYSIGDSTPAQITLAGERAEVSFNAAFGIAGGILNNGDQTDAAKASYLVMSGSHAKIHGNQGTSGGGLEIYGTGSTGLMSGRYAQISGNTSTYAGGVQMDGNAQFTMSGANAAISGNTALYAGGGVSLVDGGMFTMSGGEIFGNKVQAVGPFEYLYYQAGDGGGVEVYDGSPPGGAFTMTGGTVYGYLGGTDPKRNEAANGNTDGYLPLPRENAALHGTVSLPNGGTVGGASIPPGGTHGHTSATISVP
jgi:hypothetical protein